MSRNRPRRGEPGPDVLVSGDTGEYHPQGGARGPADAFLESGDLDAREFGVPQADLPGGVLHVVNPETHAARTAAKPERPADYHKYHGVPSDDGQYEPTPDETTLHTPAPDPVPKASEAAVPVYIVEGGGKDKVIRTLVTEGPVTIPNATVDPFRLADRDPRRVKFWICNETTASAGTAPGIRIGDWETCTDLRGLLIPAATIKDFNSQDALYCTNQSGSPVTISWGYETEIPAAGA